MNTKKSTDKVVAKNAITDEEVLKAWNNCGNYEGCQNCPLYKLDCRDLINGIIHRLQSRNELLEADHSSLLREADGYTQTIAEQKAEIERLTEEKQRLIGRKAGLDYSYNQVKEKNAELQKQVDELKEQLKQVQSSCQSKNTKIKNLNAEKEALQNELNFQNGKPHYRYVIWNTKQNKRQFPIICELTESGAYTKLFQKIGWDSAKYRFEVRRIKIDGVEVE